MISRKMNLISIESSAFDCIRSFSKELIDFVYRQNVEKKNKYYGFNKLCNFVYTDKCYYLYLRCAKRKFLAHC